MNWYEHLGLSKPRKTGLWEWYGTTWFHNLFTEFQDSDLVEHITGGADQGTTPCGCWSDWMKRGNYQLRHHKCIFETVSLVGTGQPWWNKTTAQVNPLLPSMCAFLCLSTVWFERLVENTNAWRMLHLCRNGRAVDVLLRESLYYQHPCMSLHYSQTSKGNKGAPVHLRSTGGNTSFNGYLLCHNRNQLSEIVKACMAQHV